jgi:hypothetical protein
MIPQYPFASGDKQFVVLPKMLAAACALIRDLATGPARRAMFDRLAVHPGSPADQVEYEIRRRNDKTGW